MEGFSARYYDDGLIALFTVHCNGPWATTRVDVTRLRPRPEAGLKLESDGRGRWWRNGDEAPELAGCMDVDLGCTPATNTLPIRRLELPVGGEAEIVAAWVRFPDLEIRPLRQRYRRLSPDRYEYASNTFRAEPTVDEHGMDFDFTEEQEDFRQAVREFAVEVVAPRAAEMDKRGELPMDIVKHMGELGLFGLPFPEEYGGQGADFTSLCIAIEELARIDSSIAITLEAAVGLGATPIYQFGTEEQKQRWLVPMCRGEIFGAFGLTEPGGGSDAGATKTSAKLEDGQWVINGSKAFITNAGTPISGLVTITAVTGKEPGGHKEISAIIVPTDTPGFEAGPTYRKIGWHASDTRELSFNDCRVPEENLLGERGKGFAQFLRTLDDGRIAIAALSVGLAQGCLEESVKYATERHAFGRPIGAFQALQFKIVDMKVAVETARLATYWAAWLRDQGRPYKAEASLAKLYASETAVTSAREAVQVHGGYGFMEEFAVARVYRDSKVLEIGEGTSEVQRLILARDLGLPGTEL